MFGCLLASCSEPLPHAPAPGPDLSSYRGPAPGHRGGVLVIGDWAAPATFDPLAATTAADLRAARLQFEPLWALDTQLRPLPLLVESIPTRTNGGVALTRGGMLVRLRLRAGLRWSDGDPLTAADVVLAVSRQPTPGYTATARGQRDVELRFPAVKPSYVAIGAAVFPLPAHRLAALAAPDQAAWLRHPDVGSGPFVFAGAAAGLIEMQANPAHTGPGPLQHPAYLDRLELHTFVSKTAELAAIAGGEVGAGMHLAAGDATALGESGIEPDHQTGLTGDFLVPRPGLEAPLLDAIARAVDRQALNRVVFGGWADPSTGLFPRPLTGFDGPAPAAAGRPATAGRALTLAYPCGDPTRFLEATELVREWQLASVAVTPSCHGLADVAAGRTGADLALFGDTFGPDPAAWASYARACGVPAVLEGLDRAESTLDPAARRAAYRRLTTSWLAAHCTVPLLSPPAVMTRGPKLHGAGLHPQPGLEGWNAADWWTNA